MNDVFRRLIREGAAPRRGSRRMNARRLRTLVRREVNATLRDPFTLGVLIAVPLVALLLFGFILSTKVEDMRLGVYDASRSSREPAPDRGPRRERLVPSRAASRRARRSSARWWAARSAPGWSSRPTSSASLLRATAGGAPPELRVLYDGAEAVLAGNAEAFLEGDRRAPPARSSSRATSPRAGWRRRAARGRRRRRGDARALQSDASKARPSWSREPSASCSPSSPRCITAVSIVNERLSRHLRSAPAHAREHARDPAREAAAAGRRVRVRRRADGARGGPVACGVWPQGSALLFIAISAFYVRLLALARA